MPANLLTPALPETLPEGGEGRAALVRGPHTARVRPSGRVFVRPAHGRGEAAGEGVEVVAALEDEGGWGGPDLAARGAEEGGEPGERVGLEPHAPERVRRVGVVAGGDDQDPRPVLPQHGNEHA